MANQRVDLTGHQSLVVTGTHPRVSTRISGNHNRLEIDDLLSNNFGTIIGNKNVVSINNPDIPGVVIHGDFGSWHIDGAHNTLNLMGDFKTTDEEIGGSHNHLNFNGDFMLNSITIDGTHDTVGLDHSWTQGLPGSPGLFLGSVVTLSGDGNTLNLSNGSSAFVTMENSVTQADTIDIIGNQFGKSNSVVDVFGLTTTNGVIDFQGMGFQDPTTVYNDLISNPTTLIGLAGYALHLPGRPGELFIAGNGFTKDNFQTSQAVVGGNRAPPSLAPVTAAPVPLTSW